MSGSSQEVSNAVPYLANPFYILNTPIQTGKRQGSVLDSKLVPAGGRKAMGV